ncbi:P-II family nitrogen regulator [Roseospira marina]|uniref:Nitrogen regulatory protein P-II n=1 Tax=Roseospira marina TaxID=140057 RepID=A0A5M6IGE3_9PROT|nr:P-II family nitrogen regulator [Roseospira marina]KAA5607222.1 P-II family nitrogen regulator [Roseospira marina]MBB4312627.1 PII-like signaling protein [Roseospira marina]MBB5085357.1 PII-like signaling protein [Roseospira marina]
MKFKLIIASVPDSKTDSIVDAARDEGATGCTVLTNARGQGLHKTKTFLGLDLTGARDVVLIIVEQHLARRILERIGEVGQLDASPGAGVAIQIDVEDAIGLSRQMVTIQTEIEDQI